MPLRDPRLVLFTDDVGVARVGGGWVFTVRTTDVNSMVEEDRALTDEQLVAQDLQCKPGFMPVNR